MSGTGRPTRADNGSAGDGSWVKCRVVSSEISLGKFPEIYSNRSGNFRKFLK